MEAQQVDQLRPATTMALADVSLVPSAPNGRNGFGAERSGAEREASRDPKNPASWGKVGRNEACPCGSGKSFKHCHGRFG